MILTFEEIIFDEDLEVLLGLNDTYCYAVGDKDYLREAYGISKDHILKVIKEMY